MAIAATITETGVTAPTFSEILATLQAKFREIYGQDVNLDNDSADGEWLAFLAAAYNDCNAAVIAAYNAFSPATATGEGLSSVVKVNGIRRQSASRSTADLRLVGQAGTTITNGAAFDANDNRWLLPASVVIPSGGEITVTATANVDGAITAAASTINRIATPTLGWQTVENLAAAEPGNPVETTATLRARQTKSVAAPSRSIWEGMLATVAALDGVSRLSGVDNDTNATDSNGIPAHTIAVVVEGGDAAAIASAILLKKGPGTGTYGSTTLTVADAYGIPHAVRFSRPDDVAVKARITLKALAGYETRVGIAIQQAIADYINALTIGDDVLLTRLYVPASLNGSADSLLYQLVSVETATTGSFGTSDIIVPFDGAASCLVADVTIVVVP